MELQETLDLTKICRLCLLEESMINSIFNEEDDMPGTTVPLHLRIMACLSVDVRSSDFLPSHICDTCKYQIDSWFKFKDICENADSILRRLLQSEPVRLDSITEIQEMAKDWKRVYAPQPQNDKSSNKSRKNPRPKKGDSVKAPFRKSLAWEYFEKFDKKSAKCKVCQKIIRTCGNTTNLIGHIKTVHRTDRDSVDKFQKKTLMGLAYSISIPSPLKKDMTLNEIHETKHESVPQHQPGPEPEPSTSTEEHTTLLNYKDRDTAEELPVKRQKCVQISFDEMYAYPTTRTINNALMFMICKDNQPFTIVENEGFKNLLQVTVPYYRIPCRSTVTRWVDDKFEEMSAMFRTKISTVDHLTLTSDVWSGLHKKSFLGVAAHFGIGTDFESVTLGVYQLDELHNSEYIAAMLVKSCNDWGFDHEKVSAVVTDNAVDMVNAVEFAFGKRKHIPCFAHTLNSVAQNTLQIPEVQNLLTRIKRIVGFFKENCSASDELRKVLKRDTKILQDSPTCWNTTYYMVERLLELRHGVKQTLSRLKTAPPMLTSWELATAAALLKVLQPLEAATKEITSEKYCASSKVIPLVHCLLSKLRNLTVEEPLVREMHQLILSEIYQRMGVLEHVSALAIATILDPRFKQLFFEDTIACSNAVQSIKDLMTTQLVDERYPVCEMDKSDKSLKDFYLWSEHTKLVRENWTLCRADQPVTEDELSVYLRIPLVRLNENPLDVWAEYRQQFPKLYRLAVKYLTLIASSVPADTLFTKYSQVWNQQRNRLQGRKVDRMMFLHSLEKKYWQL